MITPAKAAPSPSVAEWWSTVSLYTDQTGANVSRSILVASERHDVNYSHGASLTRLSMQNVIATAVTMAPFPVNHRNGVYLVLTSSDVTIQDFCRALCGFHYFTLPSVVGYTLPYAWVGNFGKQCPEVCAYPFAAPGYMASVGTKALNPPNRDVVIDGMINVKTGYTSTRSTSIGGFGVMVKRRLATATMRLDSERPLDLSI